MKFTPGCACCGQTPCRTVPCTAFGCNGTLAGVTITLRNSAGTVISSAVTAANGSANVPYYVSGSGYTMTGVSSSVIGYGTVTKTALSLSCGLAPAAQSFSFGVAAGYTSGCCAAASCGIPLPMTLTMDDGLGAVTVTAVNQGSGTWLGCATRTGTFPAQIDSACATVSVGSVTVTVPVYFRAQCISTGGTNQWNLSAVFLACDPANVNTPTYVRTGTTCATVQSGGSAGIGTTNINGSSCSPLLVSSTGTKLSSDLAYSIWGGTWNLSLYQ